MSNKLLNYNIDYSLSKSISLDILKQNKIVPIKNEELCILLATSDGNIDQATLLETFQKPIKILNIDAKHINAELLHYEFKQKLFHLASNAIEHIYQESENSYIINFMEEIFLFAIEFNASDIHFEAVDKSILLRLRIDGELNQIFRFDIALFSLVSSIIKYFGNLDISQRKIPLNGRFSKKIQNSTYDFRISTMPTVYGESIVLRILDNGNIQKDLDTIGFDSITLQAIKKNIHLNQGLVLVTGPTGSGKITSLYSMIQSLNTKNKKIITIEDPVEYKLEGVMQVNINTEINLDYQTVLKNILRQDPDILLIGEIRDQESLQIAIQASLTGHLVIATLHTNNALETLTRLFDLNAERYLVASTLKMILSQRLVRLLCPKCKSKDLNTNSYLHVGCEECHYTGYRNRKVISEVLTIDSTISSMISQNKHIDEIKEYAFKNGYRTLSDNAKELVTRGLTTLDEFYSKV